MCDDPQQLPNGTTVACRRCKICNANHTYDWVGRCLAEGRTSVACHSVTLTYGRDKDGIDRHERATVLTYSDVQIWLKRLRNDGYPVRYLIAGEYGTKHGRSHWHGVIFWQQRVPKEIKMYRRYWDKYWDHGHQMWKRPEPSHIAYCCKYIRKDAADPNAQAKFEFSKVPPIGANYFINKARQMVRDGIVPNDRFYSFPEAKVKKTRQPIKFYLRGATWDKFMAAYCWAWEQAHPFEDWPPSEVVRDWADKHWYSDKMLIPNPKKKPIIITPEEIREAENREAYRKAHDLYYFGKNRVGFYELDWTP